MANKRAKVSDVVTEAPTERVVTRKSYRSSINGKRNKLTVVGKEPGFVYRVVNDDDSGRVAELQERGYEIVTHKVKVGDKRVATPQGEGSPAMVNVGGGMKAFVMRQKEEYYLEDDKQKAQVVDDIESALLGAGGEYGKLDLKHKTDGQGKPEALYDIVK
jgi:hypothetical protein